MASSVQGCGSECTRLADCKSFEYSPSSRHCFLNKQSAPTEGKHEDFWFCSRKAKGVLYQGRLVSTQPLTRSTTHSLTHSLTHARTHLFTYSLTRSLTHSLTEALTHSLTHLITHSLARSLTRSFTYSLLTYSPMH